MAEIRVISPDGREMTVTEKVYRVQLKDQGWQRVGEPAETPADSGGDTPEDESTGALQTELRKVPEGPDESDEGEDLSALTRDELYQRAQATGQDVHSKATKAELVELLEGSRSDEGGEDKS